MLKRAVYYAIGDIHGEAKRLAGLYGHIEAHHAVFHQDRPRTIVHLGDYVDRGPDSCGVIDLVRSMEAVAEERDDLAVVSLRGNHEQMMLEGALDDVGGDARMLWLINGGDRAMDSYIEKGRQSDDCAVDPEHLLWLDALPDIWTAEEGRLIFVHAGIDPRTYPEDRPETHLWSRSRYFFKSADWTNPLLSGARVVHGHTPTDDRRPEISADGRRINVDTGATFGGPLTCVVIDPDCSDPVFLYA